jgi:hypothetical protein
MKVKHVLISAGTLLAVLLLKDFISDKIKSRKKPQIIVYNNWKKVKTS